MHWSKEAVMAEASRYLTRTEWFQSSQWSYRIAKEKGWFSEAAACMPRRRKKETVEPISSDISFLHLTSYLSLRSISFKIKNDICYVPSKKLAFGFDIFTPIKNRSPDFKYESRRRFEHVAKEGSNLFIVPGEMNNSMPVMEHWLEHKLGLAKCIGYARQCSTASIDPLKAADFYACFHLQGSAGGVHFGLIGSETLVACMTFSKSTTGRKGMLDEGNYVLARFALAGHVPGAASRLFKYAVDQTKAKRVVTFSDNTYAIGSVYEKLRFVFDVELEPDYRVWHPYYGIKHKSFWQRRSIPLRLKELGIENNYDPDTDLRTEFDMEHLAGCKHVWDCGKKRWIWTRNQ